MIAASLLASESQPCESKQDAYLHPRAVGQGDPEPAGWHKQGSPCAGLSDFALEALLRIPNSKVDRRALL